MKKLRHLYLAHPILVRHDIRNWEVGFEERTGIVLSNPFYDGAERADILLIDSGKRAPYSGKLDADKIVHGDLKKIDESDGLVAWVERRTPSIGTFMECWYAYTTKKPVFIVSPDWHTHPWLVFVTRHSGGFIVKTLKEFERKIVRLNK